MRFFPTSSGPTAPIAVPIRAYDGRRMSDMSVLPQRRRFTVEEYERMVEVGILHEDDRVELIEGEIVQMTPANPPHIFVLGSLHELLGELLRGRVFISPQAPVRLFPDSMPEPDLAVLALPKAKYMKQLPRPDDVLLVIEVSDTSLHDDLNRKLPLYARYGIPEAWVVDIPHQKIITARDPGPDGYADVVTVPYEGSVSPEVFPDVSFGVRDILG